MLNCPADSESWRLHAEQGLEKILLLISMEIQFLRALTAIRLYYSKNQKFKCAIISTFLPIIKSKKCSETKKRKIVLTIEFCQEIRCPVNRLILNRKVSPI